jgi:hypothetical protein
VNEKERREVTQQRKTAVKKRRERWSKKERL